MRPARIKFWARFERWTRYGGDLVRVFTRNLGAQAIVRARSILLTYIGQKRRNKRASFILDSAPKVPDRSVDRKVRNRVLVMDTFYPQPERDSGSLRMFNMLRLMHEMGYDVLFFAADRHAEDDHGKALRDVGITLLDAGTPLLMLRWWYRHGASLDVVVLSRLPVGLQFMRYACRYAAQARVVFDTVDLHFLRVGRGAALHVDGEASKQADNMKIDELGLMRLADLTLVVSEYERTLLRDLVPGAAVDVLSNVHEVFGRSRPFAERSGILFLGNFEHEPNVDAARFLVDEIMPRLRERLPSVVLHLVGYASADVLVDLAANDVVIGGFVRDLAPILDSVRVAVAPLRYGAGVKGKINMAMSYGVPVVTTSVGAEGMGLIDHKDVLIADNPAMFADAVATLYHDPSLWLELSDQGLENVKRHFSRDTALAVLERILGAA